MYVGGWIETGKPAAVLSLSLGSRHRCTSVAGLKLRLGLLDILAHGLSPPVYVGGWIETAVASLFCASLSRRHRCTSVAGLKRAGERDPADSAPCRHRCTSVAGLKHDRCWSSSDHLLVATGVRRWLD